MTGYTLLLDTEPSNLQQSLFNVAIGILAVIGTVFFIWALYLGARLMAASDDQKRAASKKRVIHAVVACLMVIILMGILGGGNMLANLTTGTGSGNFGQPPIDPGGGGVIRPPTTPNGNGSVLPPPPAPPVYGNFEALLAEMQRLADLQIAHPSSMLSPGRPALDCSAFTQTVFLNAWGIDISRTTTTQRGNINTVQIDVNDRQPGDLVMWNGHVEVYTGTVGNRVNVFGSATGNANSTWSFNRPAGVCGVFHGWGNLTGGNTWISGTSGTFLGIWRVGYRVGA